VAQGVGQGAPDETNISEAIEAVFHRIWRTVELEKAGVVRGAENTGEFERFTPSRYVEAARKVLGRIDLDPASCKQAQKIVQAKEFYTVDDDGLAKPWRGSVFLNPPYHRQLAPKFIDKLVAEIAAGRVVQAIMLVNNSTDASWFDVAARAAQSVCFTQTRINFCAPVGPDVNPTQGQAFLYYGEHGEKFEAIFCAIGWCTRPSRMYEAEAAQ
jgi:ParB family chromosome partitioning protein